MSFNQNLIAGFAVIQTNVDCHLTMFGVIQQILFYQTLSNECCAFVWLFSYAQAYKSELLTPDRTKKAYHFRDRLCREEGIRTPDTLPYTRFPSVLLKPLGHLSIWGCEVTKTLCYKGCLVNKFSALCGFHPFAHCMLMDYFSNLYCKKQTNLTKWSGINALI